MRCPICQMRTELDDLRAKHEADRIALRKCWIEGGLLNDKSTPTTIRIDGQIPEDERRELLALLRRIEIRNEETTP